MDQKLLEEAKNCLQIVDVHLGNLEIKSDNDYDFPFPTEENIGYQLKQHVLPEIRRFDASPNTGKEEEVHNIVRFDFVAAFRVMVGDVTEDAEAKKPENQSSETKEQRVLAEVKATFRTYYRITKEISTESLSEFARYNVGYHVWPYWREVASSASSKLRLPPMTLPVYKLHK